MNSSTSRGGSSSGGSSSDSSLKKNKPGKAAGNILPAHKAARLSVVKKFKINSKDTGSPEVQIALLTQRLSVMTKHFETHRDDAHSRRGMFQMISRRKKLLEYLKREDVNRYRATITALGLRK